MKSDQHTIYIFGVPGTVGGAATKIAHLVRLLCTSFQVSVILPDRGFVGSADVRRIVDPLCVRCSLLKDLPGSLHGTVLSICELRFFSSGAVSKLKEKGLRVVWSNEMMFPFKGEAEAAKEGLIDRVLFVSDHQEAAFAGIYQNVPSFQVGNYIDPDDYAFQERRNPIFSVGRLSRADTHKYPLDFPVFYEELGLREARFRVMAWSPELQKQYRWHRFGPQWDLLPANKESALKFLYSLDLFVYPLGHRIKESWGRAVVEAMLTGCVPLVPAGHSFHKLLQHGETGFICEKFGDWKAAVHELYENYPLRQKMARAASDYARESLCNPEEHRQRWIQALTF